MHFFIINDFMIVKLIFSFFVFMLLNFPLTAGVKDINNEFNQELELRKNKELTENDIIGALHGVALRNSYDVIMPSIAVLTLANKINAHRLELIWWRSNNPRVRTLVLLVYYKKYGNKGVSHLPDFKGSLSEFSDDIRRIRSKEIEDVLKFLNLKPQRKTKTPHESFTQE